MKKIFISYLIDKKSRKLVKISSSEEEIKIFVCVKNNELKNLIGNNYSSFMKYIYKSISR